MIELFFPRALVEIERAIRIDTLEDVRAALPDWIRLVWDERGQVQRCEWPTTLDRQAGA